MPMKRFYEWSAYYEIELETPTVTETALACIASYIWNDNYRDKRAPSYYLPTVEKEKKILSKTQGSNLFKGLAGIFKKSKA